MFTTTPGVASGVERDGDTAGGGATHRYRLSWAQALARVFEIDMTQCARCGQKGMQKIAVIHDARVLRAMVAVMERTTGPP